MTLAFGAPVHGQPGDYVQTRCQAFWTEDGVTLPVGSIEVVTSPEGVTSYQWSTVALASTDKAALLTGICEALRQA